VPWNVVQSNTGGYNAASGNATLPSGTTAGNTLILVVGTSSSGGVYAEVLPPATGAWTYGYDVRVG
jgi:hypothetical protein